MFKKLVNSIRCCFPTLHIKYNRKKENHEYRKLNRKYTYDKNNSEI